MLRPSITAARCAATALIAMLALSLATPAQAQVNVGSGVIIDTVNLEGTSFVGGVLNATGGTVEGTLAGLPFVAEIENLDLQLVNTTPGVCSVLDLELGPIDIDLLGLHVDTSPICLQITAIPGGGLLGDVLCSIAGNGNIPLLESLLPGILSPALTGSMQNAQNGSGGDDICDGECEILDLALGPVDLTLLGLNVLLDDCNGGPVRVCVSASEGEGLLGDLLCGLAGGGILPDLGNLEDLIGGLLDVLDADLTDRQLDRVVQQVRRALRNGVVSEKEINQLARLINRLI